MAERRGLIGRLFGRRIQAQAKQLAGAAVQQYLQELPQPRAQTIGYFGGWGRSGGAKWRGGQSSAVGGRIWDHWRTRQQARDITEDSIHAYSLVHRKADTNVDRGLRVEPTPRIGVLGIGEQEADAWAQAVAEAFDAWCQSKAQHRAGLWTFYQVQHLLQVADTRDNDEFLRLYYSQRSDLLSQLQFEVIDPNQVRGDAVTSTTMVLRGADGIERGADGTEQGYKLWIARDPEKPAEFTEVTIPRIGEKSGRRMMLHGFRPEYAGQGRGYSRLGVSMQEFENLEDYILSIVKKAINQSQLVAAIENPKNPPSNPFENLGMPPAGPGPSVTGPAPAAIVADTPPSFMVTPVEEAAFEVPGSTLIASMAEGDEIKILQNTVPGPEFDRTLDAILTPILAAHGMSLELFKIRFESSYSSARGALQVAYRVVELERSWLDANFIGPVYEAWLSCEISAGRVSCPGWQDPRLREAWTSHQLVGTPPVQIDPEKEARAAQAYLQMSATTIERVTHEHGGGNAQANIARNRRTFATLPKVPWESKPATAAEGEKEGEPPEPGSNGKSKSRRMPAGVR